MCGLFVVLFGLFFFFFWKVRWSVFRASIYMAIPPNANSLSDKLLPYCGIYFLTLDE